MNDRIVDKVCEDKQVAWGEKDANFIEDFYIVHKREFKRPHCSSVDDYHEAV